MTKKPFNAMKILKIIGLVVFYTIILFLLIFSLSTLTVKSQDNIPNILGKGFLSVDAKADSMVGENKDSFNPGDLVFVKVIKKKDRKNLDLKDLYEKGAVITFYDYSIKSFNTHRIVEYHYNEETKVASVRTQGDNKPEMDMEYLGSDRILGIYTSHIGGLGKPIAFMQTPLGFGVIVLVPMLVLLLFQGYKLIKNVYVVKEAKLKENLEIDSEEQKRRIREEVLKEMEMEKKDTERN